MLYIDFHLDIKRRTSYFLICLKEKKKTSILLSRRSNKDSKNKFILEGDRLKLFIGCGSRDVLDQDALNTYQKLIENLASIPSVNLVVGGMSSGLLKVCYDTFKKMGKKVTVILDKTRDEEMKKCTEYSDKFYAVPSTMQRSRKCYLESDMALFLEGGIGTFTEIWTFLEEKRTFQREYPIYIFNYNGIYDSFFCSLHESVQRGMTLSTDAKKWLIEEKNPEKIQEEIECFSKRKRCLK